MSDIALKLIAENKALYSRGNKAKRLDLRNTGLTVLPSELIDLFWLKELILADNPIEDISLLSGLAQLYLLDLSNTSVYDLSPIVLFASLRILKCTDTNITSIAPLKSLITLEQIECVRTQISDLSPLENLVNLTTLNLDYTKIKNIAPLQNLINLSTFYCSHTDVNDLTPLSSLTQLTTLDCSYTSISSLEPILSIIQKGVSVSVKVSNQGILVTGCNLVNPPIEVINLGSSAIIEHFSSAEYSRDNDEIRLIFLGNSTAGKTSLGELLMNRSFEIQATTHGIVTKQWNVGSIKVNILDFGGQEYYHATHRLFFGSNAIFIVVWNSKTCNGGYIETELLEEGEKNRTVKLKHYPTEWWLNNIRYLTSKEEVRSPVFLLQNIFSDDEDGAVDHYVQSEHSNHHQKNDHRHFFDIKKVVEGLSKPDEDNIQTREWVARFNLFEILLQKELLKNVLNFKLKPHYEKIRREIINKRDKGDTVITYQEFQKLCLEFDSNIDISYFIVYLRDVVGDILYYPNIKGLENIVFLDPGGVRRQIYTVLNSKVRDAKGVFTLNDVCVALQKDKNTALVFINLMKSFALVFDEVSDNGNKTGNWVAAQYLPEECPNPERLQGAKEHNNFSHAVTLLFPSFIPDHVTLCFITEWVEYVQFNLIWKKGVLFRCLNHSILIEVKEDLNTEDTLKGNKIIISITDGNKKGKIRQMLLDTFSRLDNTSSFAFTLNNEDIFLWRTLVEAKKLNEENVKTLNNPEKYLALKDIGITTSKQQSNMKKIFISYSSASKDKSYLEELKKHLSSLIRGGSIDTWDDTMIWAGERKDDVIRREIESADIVIFLISADFLASDDIFKKQVNPAMELYQAGEIDVIPIIVRDCNWENTIFKDIKVLPENTRSLSGSSNPDTIWTEIEKHISIIVKPKKPAPPLSTNDQNKNSARDQQMSPLKKVLMLTANTSEISSLNLDKEYARICEKLQPQKEFFDINLCKSINKNEFKEKIEKHKPDILHFSGHGKQNEYGGLVVFNDEKNGDIIIKAAQLRETFDYFINELDISIDLVILNACYTDELAATLSVIVPYVIATTISIEDNYSIDFSTGFYFKLAEKNGDYETAFKSGRTEAVLAGALKSDFVLYKNGTKIL